MGQEFSLLHVIQIGSGAHPASYPMGIGSSFPGGKAARREADHSLAKNAWVKKTQFYTYTPPYNFMT
jgi:hypothetical protein